MPTFKTISFAPSLRLWPETLANLEARLTRFLTELRRARLAAALSRDEPPPEDPPTEDNLPELGATAPRPRGPFVDLTYGDTERIRRRARRLVKARQEVSGVKHLRSEDVERLRGIAGGVELRGPASEHEADEIVARLYEEMPWHARVLEILWRDMRQAAGEGQGLRFRPVLLDGPPGVAKTYLGLRLAELAHVPSVFLDVATSSEGWSLAGSQRTWGSSAPGRPVSTILETRVANILICVDEVEKGGTHTSYKGGVATSAHQALLSLLEPVSARVWPCPYFGLPLDLSHLNWILMSNEAHLLPAPLRSRLRIVSVRGPTRPEMRAFAAREIARRGLDEDTLDTVEALIRAYPEADEQLSLRTLLRIIDDLAAIAHTTEVQH